MKNIAILSTIFIVFLFFITSSVYSATLQGRLDKFGPLGIVPAPFISVTLYSEINNQNITVNSGSNGMYYFDDIEPGNYILKIWVKGFRNDSINYEICVLNQKTTIIEPKVIHSIQFDIPEEGKIFLVRTYFIARGTHYSLPENTFLWALFSDLSNNFYFCNDHPIVINKNGTWKTRKSFLTQEYITKINIVIVTPEANKIFKAMSRLRPADRIRSLPKDSFILTSQDIKVHVLGK